MKMTELQNHADKLDEKTKVPILALIELKTDSDMEKAIGIIQNLKTDINNVEKRLESKFESVVRLIHMLFWAIGFIAVLITIFNFI